MIQIRAGWAILGNTPGFLLASNERGKKRRRRRRRRN
jgi:hypothetical protein